MVKKNHLLLILFSILGGLALVLVALMWIWISIPGVEYTRNWLNKEGKRLEKNLIESEYVWYGLSLEETRKKKDEFIQNITSSRSIDDWTQHVLTKENNYKYRVMFGVGGLSLVFFILAFVDMSKKWNNFKGWSSLFIICLAGSLLLYSFLNLIVISAVDCINDTSDKSYFFDKYYLAEYKNYQEVVQYINDQLKKIVQGKKSKEKVIAEVRKKYENLHYLEYLEKFAQQISLPIEGMKPEDYKKERIRTIEENFTEDSFEEWAKGKRLETKFKENKNNGALFWGFLGIIFLILAFVDKPKIVEEIKEFLKTSNKVDEEEELKRRKKLKQNEILDDKDFKVEILNKNKEIAEAEEAIATIKKRTASLFEKPKKGMTAGERLRDRERRRQEYLQIVEELKKDLPPEQQERLDAEAYQEIEKIK